MKRKYTPKKYTLSQLIEAVKSSRSLRQVMIKVKITPIGGNYKAIKNKIKSENIDTSHFTGLGWLKGKKLPPKRPTEDYLSNKAKITSNALRIRLLNERIFEHKCYNCELTHWLDHQIPLELHHIDRNHDNNNLSNLQLLCPTCHALVHKPKPKPEPNEIEPLRPKLCAGCNKEISIKATNCKSCALKLREKKITWPSTQELLHLASESSYLALSKKLGVSDNAIRKRIKTHPNE